MVRQSELASHLPEPQDPVVCRCLMVRESAIVNAVSLAGAETIKDVRSLTGAGAGCTCCHRRINELISGCASCPIRRMTQAVAEESNQLVELR